jgi:hypothetical protein
VTAPELKSTATTIHVDTVLVGCAASVAVADGDDPARDSVADGDDTARVADALPAPPGVGLLDGDGEGAGEGEGDREGDGAVVGDSDGCS